MGRVRLSLLSVSVKKKKNTKASFALKFTLNFLLLFGQGRREGQGKMDIAGDRAEMEE